MGLYNFQPRFVPFILDGRKRHTIRKIRKHADVSGDTLYLYQGLRTKKAKLLFATECLRVEEIEIIDPVSNAAASGARVTLIRDGVRVPLSIDEREMLAQRDGFENFEEMIEFWRAKHDLPFHGHLIHWKYPAPEKWHAKYG